MRTILPQRMQSAPMILEELRNTGSNRSQDFAIT
jgi:hypothetical protein